MFAHRKQPTFKFKRRQTSPWIEWHFDHIDIKCLKFYFVRLEAEKAAKVKAEKAAAEKVAAEKAAAEKAAAEKAAAEKAAAEKAAAEEAAR